MLENFLTKEFGIGLSLVTISSIMLLVGNLTNNNEFKKLKKTLLWIFWASIVFLIGSIFYGAPIEFNVIKQIGFGFIVIGIIFFILCLLYFTCRLTGIILKN